MEQKASTEETRKRFDTDVERFSNLETGQAATIDAPLVMELITQAAVACTSNMRRALDVGCGAGNNTLKLLQHTSPFDCDLVDLSQPMLNKAYARITEGDSPKRDAQQNFFTYHFGFLMNPMKKNHPRTEYLFQRLTCLRAQWLLGPKTSWCVKNLRAGLDRLGRFQTFPLPQRLSSH
jgi:SAM-dependent methyltransferase